MNEEIGKLTSWSWEAIGALCCFSGGIVAAIVGSTLTVLTWIIGVHPWVRSVGTVLLVLTIPLLIFSGYCLDWMEQGRMNRRK
ncbi:MAG: hypothetical protein ACR2LM_06960 [Pyrinomonadaceae bacterium]